ncbi:MAG: ABC transporter ATP-binding protein, partial [Sulfurimonas sp.]|nr:ABC transporter ATP-binding protein [Sulfurimonas sp.]
DEMQSLACGNKPKEFTKEKQKNLKLTFKEKIALEKLPDEIDELELKMEEKNKCLANPKCYEDMGISALAKELQEIEELYEQKVEELLTIQEKEEEINS